jgi:hypothetical protein
MNKYILDVKCVLEFEIDAPNEKAARKKLEKKPDDQKARFMIKADAYKKATLDRSSFLFSEEDSNE